MKRLAYLLALVHLVVIGLAVTHGVDPLLQHRGLDVPLAVLRDVNYSVWRYSFFAPDVGVSTEVAIRVTGTDGTALDYSTASAFRFFTASSESANRFYGLKRRVTTDSLFGDLAARSIATRLVNLHDAAARIDLTMQSIRFPTMQRHRLGERPAVAPLYATVFGLR